jgi:outer membrane protein W
MKKLIAIAAGLAVASAAVAGGMDSSYSAPAVAVASPATNLYVQAQLGFAQTNWKNQTNSTSAVNWDKGNGGFAWGADIGYSWTKNLAVELGGFMLPKATATATVPSLGSDTAKTLLGYAAVKFSVPVMSNVELFAKAGLGYNRTKVEGDFAGARLASSGTYHHWGFMGGIGADYSFGNNLFASVQYLRFSGKTESTAVQTTNPNVWTAGIGYKFSM